MDKETRDYYESLLDMFMTDGWSHFKTDFTESLRHMIEHAYEDCPEANDWIKRRGEIEVLTRVVGFEEFIRESFDQLDALDDSL